MPAAILPSDLQISLNLINQFLESPLDLEGKKASQLLSKKRRRARRRAPSNEPESDTEMDEEARPKRKERKKKEAVQYKSAQFIEDSDAELGDDDEFFQKEAALRARTAIAAAEGRNANMKTAGTKKRKKPKEGEGRDKKKWKGSAMTTTRSPSGDSSDSDPSDTEKLVARSSYSEQKSVTTPPEESPQKPRARPRPKPIFKSNDELHGVEASQTLSERNGVGEDDVSQERPTSRSEPSSGAGTPKENLTDDEMVGVRRGRRKIGKVVLLSEEEDG